MNGKSLNSILYLNSHANTERDFTKLFNDKTIVLLVFANTMNQYSVSTKEPMLFKSIGVNIKICSEVRKSILQEKKTTDSVNSKT